MSFIEGFTVQPFLAHLIGTLQAKRGGANLTVTADKRVRPAYPLFKISVWSLLSSLRYSNVPSEQAPSN